MRLSREEIMRAATTAEGKLQRLVEYGKVRAIETLQNLQNNLPQDYLPRPREINFEPIFDSGVVKFQMKGKEPMGIHTHALHQVADKAGIPWTYMQTLREDKQADLLATNLNMRMHGSEADKYLVRVVNQEMRGFLSDKYRRMDSSPIVESYLRKATEFGAVPLECQCLDTKVYIKMALPHVYKPYEGEPVLVGMCFQNSDFGDGAISLKAWIMRLVCINGMLGEDGFRKVHLGARLDDISFSQKTYELDTQTMASAVTDVVQHVMNPEAITRRLELIKAAHEKKVDADKAIDDLQKGSKITKGEAKDIKEIFGSAEVEMLPPGNSAWRLSNAIALFAQKNEDGRALELEALAGQVVGLQQVAA